MADGGVSYCVDHHVTARAAKDTFGLKVSVLYDPTDREHVQRSSEVYTRDVTGEVRLGLGFSTILSKVSRVYTQPRA